VEIVGKKTYLTTCIGVEMYRKILDTAEAGENVGVLVRGISKHDISRGYLLCSPKTIIARNRFEAKAYILTKLEGGRTKPFFTNFKPQFFFRTSNVTGTILLKNEEGVAIPGDTIEFVVELLENVGLTVNLRFAIREGTLTIGAGVITKLL
jgi:elongation factor Tu